MSERPWWFPTAVFVAPVCGVAFWLMLEFESRLPWAVVGGVSFLALVMPFIDLARREDRRSDRTRPAHLNRWGFDHEVHPWRSWAWHSTLCFLMFGGLGAAVLLVSVASDELKPLLVVLTGAAVIAVLFWWLKAAWGKPWVARPEWQTAFVWRWPVTTGIAMALLATVCLAFSAWNVAQGSWGFLLPAVVLFAQPFLRSLIRLFDASHPDRNWGQRVTT